eukprot:7238393-Pyramimonas_sp.AAC.1
MCPGKAHQRGLPDTLNDHMTEITKMVTGRGIGVLLADQWIKQQERPRINSWHPQKTAHDLVQLTQQFMYSATLRNLSAVSLWLPTQPFPFRHPLIQPVSDYQGHTQAQGMREALRIRLEQSTQFQRSK